MRTPVLVLLTLTSATALAVPMEFNHQGRLFDATGIPVDGAHELNIYLYDAPSSGTVVWTNNYDLDFEDGYFAVSLAEDVNGDPLTTALVDQELWVALGLDAGPELPGRHQLVSVPYAVLSDTATNVDGGVVNAAEVQINGTTVIDSDGNISNSSLSWDDLIDVPDALSSGVALGGLTCVTGQIAVFDGLDWQCVDANDHSHDASDLTAGTIDIARLPVGGGSAEVAAGDHLHSLANLTGQTTIDQLPTGTGAAEVALGDHAHAPGDADTLDGLDSGDFAGSGHAHDAADVTSGVFAVTLIPDLDAAKINAGTLDTARLDVGTTASQVAAGDHTHTAADVGAMPAGGGSFSGDVTVDGTLTVPNGQVADIRDFAWTQLDTLAQIQAQAICTAMNGNGQWTFAVPKQCNNGRTCAQECAANTDGQAGTLGCFNSLHIYGNSPVQGVGADGLKTYKYGSCGGGCGPNFCCCR